MIDEPPQWDEISFTFFNSLHLQELLHMLTHNVHLGGDADGLPTLGDQGAVGGGELSNGLLPALYKELSKAHVNNLTEIPQGMKEGKPP